MRITSTENALRCLEFHPEYRSTSNSLDCFKGLRSGDYLLTPDISNEVDDICTTIDILKKELNGKIKRCCPSLSVVLPSEIASKEIIENIDITLITRADERITHIPVRNLFKYSQSQNSEFSYETIVVTGPDDKDDKDDKNKNTLLGLYNPSAGAIVIWIDKILEHRHPELIFQKVLLHEIIHALLDIHPRVYFDYINGIRILSSIGNQIQEMDEETLDNALVLKAYEDSKDFFISIRAFVSDQPKAYSKSISIYDSPDLLDKLKHHLSQKISYEILQSQKNMFLSLEEVERVGVERVEEDKDDVTEFSNEIVSEYFTLIPHFLPDPNISLHIVDKTSIFNDLRILTDSEWFHSNFLSPWLVWSYYETTREMMLQVGKTWFIRYNFENINEISIRESNGKIKIISKEDLYAMGHSGEFVANFIDWMNPKCFGLHLRHE